VMAAGIFLPMAQISHVFKLQPLPLQFFPWLIAILLGYMALTQAMKGFFVRRYGWQ
jgi:Mg2+-importing ATPase